METFTATGLLDMSILAPSRRQTRRDFVRVGARIGVQAMVLGALPGACRLAAHAEATPNVTRVAFLAPGSATTPFAVLMQRAFREGLRDVGRIENETFIVESRFAEGKFERIPELVAELVRLDVKAIAAIGSPAAAIVKRETTIPIVMIGDPVGIKLAATVDRPGGTVTGLASNSEEICGKRLRLLKAVAPSLTRVAFVANPANPAIPGILRMTRVVAEALRIELIPVDVQTEKDMEHALETMVRAEAQAFVFYPPGPMQDARVIQIAEMAIRHRLPWSDEIPRNATLGALLAYGADYPDLARRAAGYVDKILKGASPAGLPLGLPSKVEFAVNMKTADALGLAIPGSILAEATNVVR